MDVELHRITNGSWGQGNSFAGGGGGAPSQTNDASWYYMKWDSTFAAPRWTTPGGDFVTTASAIVQVPFASATPYVWTDGGLISDVQAWVDNPASNFGWMVK